jgi:hypothetical protein
VVLTILTPPPCFADAGITTELFGIEQLSFLTGEMTQQGARRRFRALP